MIPEKLKTEGTERNRAGSEQRQSKGGQVIESRLCGRAKPLAEPACCE